MFEPTDHALRKFWLLGLPLTPIHRRIGNRRACRSLLSSPGLRLPRKIEAAALGALLHRRTLSQGQHAVPRDARAAPKTMMRSLATSHGRTCPALQPDARRPRLRAPALDGAADRPSPSGPTLASRAERVWRRRSPFCCAGPFEQLAPRGRVEDFQT